MNHRHRILSDVSTEIDRQVSTYQRRGPYFEPSVSLCDDLLTIGRCAEEFIARAPQEAPWLTILGKSAGRVADAWVGRAGDPDALRRCLVCLAAACLRWVAEIDKGRA